MTEKMIRILQATHRAIEALLETPRPISEEEAVGNIEIVIMQGASEFPVTPAEWGASVK